VFVILSGEQVTSGIECERTVHRKNGPAVVRKNSIQRYKAQCDIVTLGRKTMNGIFGDHNFEPVQPELAVWPVCSRAAFFLPTRIKLKLLVPKQFPWGRLWWAVQDSNMRPPACEGRRKFNLSRCFGCAYQFQAPLRLLQSCSKDLGV